MRRRELRDEARPGVFYREIANLTGVERSGELRVRNARRRNARALMLDCLEDDEAERDRSERGSGDCPARVLAQALADEGESC